MTCGCSRLDQSMPQGVVRFYLCTDSVWKFRDVTHKHSPLLLSSIDALLLAGLCRLLRLGVAAAPFCSRSKILKSRTVAACPVRHFHRTADGLHSGLVRWANTVNQRLRAADSGECEAALSTCFLDGETLQDSAP